MKRTFFKGILLVFLISLFSSSLLFANNSDFITLKFKNANIRTVLNLIAAKADVNIIAGPEVNAVISVSFENVPWEKALQSILQTYHFGYEKDGNIIRVMSVANMTKETPRTRIINLKYARAEEVEKSIRQMLSLNGKISVTPSSNSVIITDVPNILSEIELISRDLDETQRRKDIIKEKQRLKELKKLEEQKQEQKKLVNLTLKYESADIRSVLNDIAYKTQLNIIIGKNVEGIVDLNMKDIPWWDALESLMKAYSLGYEPEQSDLKDLKPGDIINITTLEKMAKKKELERKLDEVQDLVTKVFTLNYIDASVVKDALLGKDDDDEESSGSGSSGSDEERTLLSERGSIIVISKSITPGWEFNTDRVEQARQRTTSGSYKVPSKFIAVTDIPNVIKKVEQFINQIDIKPKQVLIESKILEINVEDLKNLGVEWKSLGQEAGHGRSQAQGNYNGTALTDRSWTFGRESENESAFNQAWSAIPSFTAESEGISFLYQKMSDMKVEVLIHAMEQNQDTNVLSAPRIITTDSREAGILVGKKYPIVQTTTTETGETESVEYIDIGIQLYVIPRIIPDGRINLIVHPVVSEFNSFVGVNPVIDTREADTSVITKSNETIVIGGLIKDKAIINEKKIPFLGDIPLLGFLFKSKNDDIDKIELLCFLKGTILEESNEKASYGSLDLSKNEKKFLQDLKISRRPKKEIKKNKAPRTKNIKLRSITTKPIKQTTKKDLNTSMLKLQPIPIQQENNKLNKILPIPKLQM